MIKLKDIILEAETFTAINKDTGKVSVFKSKDSRDAAIKGGTHDKKAEKGGDSSAGKKDTPKVNIFDKPKKKDEPKRDADTDAQIDDVQNNIGDLDGDEMRDYAESDIFPYLKGKDLETAKMFVDDIEDSGSDFVRSADVRKDLKDLFDKKMTLDSPKEEPKKDEPKSEPSKPRPGNPQVNKVVRNKAQSLGVTPQKLGKEEYEKRMSQAAVEALTDANFHSESRALIAVLEDNPELAKNPSDDPNKPDMFSDEYDEWKKGTAWGSSFGDSSDGTDDIAHSATGESSWDGQESIDAIAFDLKMNGSHKLAAKIQSIFDEKNESTVSIADMIPESVQINEGTRSQVGVIGRNGKIVSAYVHYDGYPSNMKPGLKHHMKSDKDVLKLIKMGGARGIFDDKEIEYYKNGSPTKGDMKDFGKYVDDADRSGGAEFIYLYNMKDKKWYFANVYGDKKLKKLF